MIHLGLQLHHLKSSVLTVRVCSLFWYYGLETLKPVAIRRLTVFLLLFMSQVSGVGILHCLIPSYLKTTVSHILSNWKKNISGGRTNWGTVSLFLSESESRIRTQKHLQCQQQLILKWNSKTLSYCNIKKNKIARNNLIKYM